ncbi:MAG: GH92 family glycosyl hydrolase [Bacteroidota bacterium]|nr:GH92 family glycosyl hydrolase [Bacteroidota bacterium]
MSYCKLRSIFSGNKKQIILYFFFYLFILKAGTSQNLIQYVQPLSGTASSTTASALKHSEAGSEGNANTIPSVGLPFAMTQWTPQTRTGENKCVPPYFYKDSLLSGFRGTHWLSGSCTQDYGSVTIMPVTGNLRTTAKEYEIPFSHNNEIATPAYYQLTTQDIITEITSTLRCGIMKFTLLKDDSLYLLVMPNRNRSEGFVKINAEKGEIWGYNPVHRIYQGWGQPAGFNGWFYIKVEKKIGSGGTFSADEIFNLDSIKNKKDLGAFIGFNLRKGEKIVLKIGTSFSSLEGAKKNLYSEIGSRNFDEIETSAKKTWQDDLSQIKVYTTNVKYKRIFYTAMYHAMELPRLYNDVDGTYPKFSGNYELMNSGKRNYYDDFSMWDIYRAQLPLQELLKPARIDDIVQSMINKGKQGEWLPIFPCWNSYTSEMIGDHVTAFIASAFAKGIRNYDVEEAYILMRKNAFTVAGEKDYADGKGRRALSSYMKYNFIPLEDAVPIAFHKKEQVSRTLEYAYDDYALYTIAKDLNKKEDEEKLFQRAFNYKNVFDKSVGMVRGHYEDGTWYSPFDPDTRQSYITEGTPRQYTFYVPQDVPGLAKLMGGRDHLEKELDSLFDKDEYWHGNEPGHQIPFMYNYTNAPWKSQRIVRKILNEEYSDGPGGLSGNDDAGQMSAWYVFAAMGFYPLDPVSGNYMMVSPLFDSIKIKLPREKSFEIITHKTNQGDQYIKEVKWNGKIYDKNYLQHSSITKGGKLEIWLQKAPTSWGGKISQQPEGLKKNK